MPSSTPRTWEGVAAGRGGGTAIGGGAGVLVLIVALLLGVDPGDLLGSQPAAPSATGVATRFTHCTRGSDISRNRDCRFVAFANSIQDRRSGQPDQRGQPRRPQPGGRRRRGGWPVGSATATRSAVTPLPATPSDPSSTAIAVRRAVATDVESVTACQTACWQEAYAGLVPDDYLYSAAVRRRRLNRWRERLADGRNVWLAEDGDRVVGVVRTGPSRDEPAPTAIELMSLYLRSSHHGSGLADRLLHAAVGTGPASLWVFADNPRAQRFYVRHGFAADGTRKLDPDTGIPEIRMVRLPEPDPPAEK